MRYSIRKIERGDMPQLMELLREHAAYEQAGFFYTQQDKKLTDQLFAPAPRLFCWVVEDAAGGLAGYCAYMPEYSTWRATHFIHMDCLYLRAEARNRHLGQRLMQKMCGHARELGIDEIQWQTPHSNTDAIRFYNRMGANHKLKCRFFLDPFTVGVD